MPNKMISKAAQRATNIEKDIDVENRKVRFCFMTEAPCENWYVPEVCLCERENADLTRFENGVAPVLFNHDRDKIIGKIDKIEFIDKRAYAEVVLDTDEESEKVFQKIQSGSLRGVSVGYLRKTTTRVEADNEFLGVRYAERTDVTSLWELLEVSIVSIPADSDTGVGRELGDFEPAALPQNIKKEINEMEDLNKETIDVAAEREAARKAEVARTQTILGLCRDFNVSAEQQDKYLSENMTIDAVRASIMDGLKAKTAPSNVQMLKDESEKLRDAMADAMCLRTGVAVKDAAAGAEQMRGMSLRRMAEEVLEREGVHGVRYMNDEQLCKRAMGSGAFAGIVDDYANKVKLASYAEQPFIFKNFVSMGQNKDFKPNYKYEMGLSGLPVLMPQESGEFQYQEMGDAKVATMVQTYGKAIKFTREIFINDALGEVKEAIALQAGGFRRLQEKMFFETLTGITYSAAKGNLVQTNKAISALGYGEMINLMMKQKDVNGEGYIGVAPFAIIAPVEQTLSHKTLIASASDPAQNNAGVINPVQNSMVLFTSPYLSGDAYYAVARPGQMRGIEFTTLNGVDTIQSRTITPSNYLGIEYQMWADFGFNVLSHKAFVKNPNA